MKRVLLTVAAGVIGVTLAVVGVALALDTVTGTVVSVSTDKLVIRTDSGDEQTFELRAESRQPANVRVGDRIMVESREDLGRDVVTQMTMAAGTTAVTGTTGTTYGTTATPGTTSGYTTGTTSGTTGTAREARDTRYTTSSENVYGTTGTEAEANMADNDLPATASPLPLIALAGLASLSSAFGLRRLARRQK